MTTYQNTDETNVIAQVKAEKQFYINLFRYFLIVSFLFAINTWTNPQYIWAWYPAIGWGIAMLFNAIYVFSSTTKGGLADRWQEKQIKKRLNR
jgi:hypothetical protein